MGLDALAFSLKRVPWPYAAKLLGRAEGHEFCDLKPAAAWTFQDLPFTHEHLNLAPPVLTASKSLIHSGCVEHATSTGDDSSH